MAQINSTLEDFRRRKEAIETQLTDRQRQLAQTELGQAADARRFTQRANRESRRGGAGDDD
jgi:hypothetical protein